MRQTNQDYEAMTFVVRLWREPRSLTSDTPGWRGRALHVQSGTERGIQDLDAVMSFIQSWLQSDVTASGPDSQ
ncbi:MAG: hypothetical protein GX573_24815 [Chloroflexi bacterium]|nr:hypothetical protein [Chloroflexota bacterium]